MILTDNRGILTVQFILATFISLFMVITFFALALTFVHISATQYMSYSTARRLSLGGIDKDQQRTKAVMHYSQLRSKLFDPSAYKPGDWFEISTALNKDSDLGFASNCPGSTINAGYSETSPERCLFYGARIEFKSNVTNFRIPGLINTKTVHKTANVMSFLGREPSRKECSNFFDRKELEIKSHWIMKNGMNWGNIDDIAQTGDNGC